MFGTFCEYVNLIYSNNIICIHNLHNAISITSTISLRSILLDPVMSLIHSYKTDGKVYRRLQRICIGQNTIHYIVCHTVGALEVSLEFSRISSYGKSRLISQRWCKMNNSLKFYDIQLLRTSVVGYRRKQYIWSNAHVSMQYMCCWRNLGTCCLWLAKIDHYMIWYQ